MLFSFGGLHQLPGSVAAKFVEVVAIRHEKFEAFLRGFSEHPVALDPGSCTVRSL